MFTKDKWYAVRDAFAEVAVKSGKFKVKKVTDKKITLTRPDTPGLKEAVLMLVGPGNLYWICTTLDGVSGSQVSMYSRADTYDMPSYVSLKPHLSIPATRKWVWESIAENRDFAKVVAKDILSDVESASRDVIRTDVYPIFVDTFTAMYATLKGAQKVIRKGDRVYFPTGDPEKAYIYIGERENDGTVDFMNIYSARDTNESSKKLLAYINMRVVGSDSNSQLLAGAKQAFNYVFSAKIRESLAATQNQVVPKAPNKEDLAATIRAKGKGGDYAGADLRGLNLEGADLRGADFRKADLRGANLKKADLYNAIFDGANLEGADLQGANLEGAARFTGANLSRADFRGAFMEGCWLDSANLQDTDLRRANLQGASLLRVDLSTANLVNTRYDKYTEWPIGFYPPKSAINESSDGFDDDDDEETIARIPQKRVRHSGPMY